jgi:hypothetical protein
MCRVLSFIFYWFGMVRRKLTIPERWQAVGMHNCGFSHRRVADHFRVNHSIIVRLMQRFRRAWRRRKVNWGRSMGGRARISRWWRSLITVRELMSPPNAKLPRSAPTVLNGRCTRLDMSRSSLGVVLQGLPARGWSVTFPRLTKTLHQSYNDGIVNPYLF